MEVDKSETDLDSKTKSGDADGELSGVGFQFRSVFANKLRGCSLGEALRIVENNYRLFNLEREDGDAMFIHRDFAPLLPQEYRGKRNIYEMWEQSQ